MFTQQGALPAWGLNEVVKLTTPVLGAKAALANEWRWGQVLNCA